MTSPRPLFDRILADEPPLSLTLDGVVAHGRRVRRRRYATYAVSAAAVTAVAVAAVGMTSTDRATGPARPAATPSADAALTRDQQVIARAIVDNSPARWTFDLSAGRWNPYGVDGVVDDGAGPARLFVRLTENLGFDGPMCIPDYPDYNDETCGVTTVEGGEVRVRERAEAGRSYLEASFVRPGLAVYVLTGNHTVDAPWTDGATPTERVTRDRSPYDAGQLTGLLTAIARAARDANVTVTDPPEPTLYM